MMQFIKIDFRTNEFQFNFSQPLNQSTVSLENIIISNIYSGDLDPILNYVDSYMSLNISFNNKIVSMDSISVILSENLTNIYGYELDGNGDGVGGDPIEVTYRTSMLGDYNDDMEISVEDLSQFIINWEDKISLKN